MLLTSVARVRASLGVTSMVDLDAAITEALHAAEETLATKVSSRFARATATDVFWLERPQHSKPYIAYTNFRLKHGFLVSATGYRLDGGQRLMTEGTDISSDLVFEMEKGFVFDPVTPYDRQGLRVEYTYGFEAADADSYDLTQVPGWLQQAALLEAQLTMASNPEFKEKGIRMSVTYLSAQLDMLLRSHLRYAPHAKLPIHG